MEVDGDPLVAPIPEPSTLSILAAALGIAGWCRAVKVSAGHGETPGQLVAQNQ
jgi:hypothetical protein